MDRQPAVFRDAPRLNCHRHRSLRHYAPFASRSPRFPLETSCLFLPATSPSLWGGRREEQVALSFLSASLLPGWPTPESPTGTGPDFISCAFVFRLDYARGYKWKIRYAVDTPVRSRDIWLAYASPSPIAALRSSFPGVPGRPPSLVS